MTVDQEMRHLANQKGYKAGYTKGYRAGVGAMRDAAMREFGDVPKRLLDEADTIWEVAARLLEEKP